MLRTRVRVRADARVRESLRTYACMHVHEMHVYTRKDMHACMACIHMQAYVHACMQAYLEAVTLCNNFIHLLLSVLLAREKIVDIDNWRHLTYRAVCIALRVEARVPWFDGSTGC